MNRLQPMFGRGSSKSATANARRAENDSDATLALLHGNLARLRAIGEAEETSIKPLSTDCPTCRSPELRNEPTTSTTWWQWRTSVLRSSVVDSGTSKTLR